MHIRGAASVEEHAPGWDPGLRGGHEMHRGQPPTPARGSHCLTLIGDAQNARRAWICWYFASRHA